MNTPEARKIEMVRFLTKFPSASTSQVVDHMMEKFEETKRHQHRAMLQRVKGVDVPQAPEAQHPKPNGATKPRSKKTVATSATSLPPQKGGVRKIDAPEIPRDETISRRQRVLEVWHELGEAKATPERILRIVRKEFSEPAPEPTLAMAIQACRAMGDHERYPELLSKLYDDAVCPQCGKKAVMEDEIYALFGFREQNRRRQSSCRTCRPKSGKKK